MSDSGALSTPARAAQIDRLERETFDLLVIGGGITGAGLARDAALRGLSVALLEANDFSSGTSSRSSKLIHGGLRYLERGEINLVRKTVSERKEIHRLAPHLTEPRWMVLPLKGRATLYSLRLAVTAYERLGGVAAKDLQQTWSGETLERNEPLIDRDVFRFALAYREYLTDDARLVLANMRSAAGAGATAINHTPVTGFIREGGKAVGAQARCASTGREFAVRARVIVNAAGPWVEALQHLEDDHAKPFLHLSKGVHICLPASVLPISNLLVLDTRDGRRIFALRREDVVYIGTTDRTYERGAQHWPEIEREEVEYLLEPIPRHFTLGPIGPEQVISAWSGLRPLLADPTKKNPSELSRRDELLTGPLGVLSVAGGKLTGYRGMARRVLATVGKLLERSLPELALDEEPLLPGGDIPEGLELSDYAATLATERSIDAALAARLARLYGTEAHAVLDLDATPLYPGARAVQGEVRWAIEREGAVTLEDLYYRRTRLPLFDVEPRKALAPLAMAMAAVMGWDADQTAREVSGVEAQFERDLTFV